MVASISQFNNPAHGHQAVGKSSLHDHYFSKLQFSGDNGLLSVIPGSSVNSESEDREKLWKECVRQFGVWLMTMDDETFGSDRYNADW